VEQQNTEMLGFRLAVGVLDFLRFVLVAVKVGKTIDAGEGGFAEKEDFVTVFDN
jgi:hypothetical protein